MKVAKWESILRKFVKKMGITEVAARLDVRENTVYHYLKGRKPCEKIIRKILVLK